MLALTLGHGSLGGAIARAWPPFLLVTGLLLIGLVADRDGLYEAGAARLVRLPGRPVVLLVGCYLLVALVTALLNLDTAAVFLTPVLIGVARRRGLAAGPFLYGSVFMANASSLFLPGSNLTNLLVLSGTGPTGTSFLARMLPFALAAPLVTGAGLLVIHRGALRAPGPGEAPAAALASRLGLLGALAAVAAMVLLANAALAVLGVGLVLVALRMIGGRLSWAEIARRVGPGPLIGLFAVSVALGTLARASSFPSRAMASADGPLTAVVGALASVLVNNLPAASLLGAARPRHASALLVGLNLGPNLAVTGSLSALLWWRAARAAGARPSALSYSRQGLLLAPLAIAGALAAGGLL